MAEWVRHGDCSNCGYCCIFLGSLVLTLGLDKPDLEFMNVREISSHTDPTTGETIAYKKINLHAPCPAFSGVVDEPGCTIYKHRPKTCRDFPLTPTEIIDTPCSYWFEMEDTGITTKVGGKGSPYPQAIQIAHA